MEQLINEINQFRDERDWRQFHNAKDLAISISLEASELLENFQWKSPSEALERNNQNIQDEMADVFIYLMMLATDLDLDMTDVVREKLIKNRLKYPIDTSYGSKEKGSGK